jgi:hypothetical protein
MRARITAAVCWLALPWAVSSTPVLHAEDEVELAVIVHSDNALTSVSAAELESIFTSSRRHWRGGSNIVAFNYPPKHPLRVRFDKAVLRMDPDEVSRFWVDQKIRGRRGAPRQVPSARLMVRVVERLPEAIGYVPKDELGSHEVKVLAWIRGGRVVEP